MNKTVMWLAIALIVVAGIGFAAKSAEPGDLLYPLKTFFSGEVTYVADIAEEIVELENELAEIEAALEAGTMSEEDAVVARERILTRIGNINASVERSEQATLTSAQRAQLQGALTQLTNILTTYRDSLVKLDDAAGGALTIDDRPRLNPRGRGGGGGRSLVSIITDTAESLVEYLEEAVGEPVDDSIEEMLDEVRESETSEDDPESTEDSDMDGTQMSGSEDAPIEKEEASTETADEDGEATEADDVDAEENSEGVLNDEEMATTTS